MARLHVLGDWHGPGEERTARRLSAELPATWDIVAGRDVPDGMGTVDLDLVVVGPRAVYVCEEKSWGRHIVAGDVAWFVNGERRHSPNSQVQHATRVLAGRIKTRVTGWREAENRFPRGHRIVRGHVVLSHDNLELDGAAELGDDIVLRLVDAAETLQRLDATCPESMAPLRAALMEFLLGLRARPVGEPPSQIFQYRVQGRPMSRGDAVVYATRNPANELVDLICVPVAAASDPVQAHLLATREHDALAALASADRAWRVQGWFEWNGYVVTPVVVPTDGTSLRKLVASRRSPVDDRGRVTPDVGVAVVHDAFSALADVHRHGITHRALRLLSIEVTDADRVRFRDFGRAHLPSAETVAPALQDDHPSAAFRAPGTTLEMFTESDDLYSLALCLVQWLHGDATDQPDHALALERAREYPTVGPVLVRCLTREPGAVYTAAEAAGATGPRTPAPPLSLPSSEVVEAGALLAGRYRLVRQLGEGAWAVTWLAYDENLDEHRTIKHLRPGRVTPEQVRAEYDHANMLRSFFCARMHDRLALPDPGVLVQEYVPGETLHELTTGRPELDREQARRVAVDVLRGLADAHDRSIYHRDVSPNNIIVRDDGHAVLIDFGLASRAEAAQSAVGSPPFTAPEVWSRRQWSPSADIYSAAASVLRAMLGRLPYAGPGIDERRTLVPPTASQVERYGRALLDALYRAVEADPVARPSDARAFADELQRVSDIVVAPGHRVVNPTVAALRGLYRHSGIGNAGNRGLDDAFAHDTYVATRLDSELLPAIVAGGLDVVVLSGNPGDGKTSFLVKVGSALDRAGAVTVHSDAAGWRRRLDGRTFSAVYDASESHGELTSDDLMCRALDPGDGDDPTERTVLLAANDGRIAQFCADHTGRYPQITASLDRQRLGGDVEPDARIVLVDLKRRALALPDLDGPALGANVLSSLTVLHRWQVCEGCEARQVCPIRRNAELLRAGQARRAVAELLLTSHLRRRRRATVRDVRSAFGWLVTGDLACDDVHDEVEQGLDPGVGRQAFDLAFDARSGDYLVQEWAELDPARLPAPAMARAARDRRDLVPDLAGLDTGAMTHLKRALFFGSWSVPTARHEVRSYRHLEPFLDALRDPAAGLSRILLGVSRVLAFIGYRDEGHLALRDRAFDDPAVRSIVVVKELPAAEFRLASTNAAAPYVESFPDQLELRHAPSGARLRITLDTAELLLRSADGEILGDTASAALRQEIQGFGDRLRLQPARTVRIVDGAGAWVTATATEDGHIVAGVHR